MTIGSIPGTKLSTPTREASWDAILFFVGYSANAENLWREIHWGGNRLQGDLDHIPPHHQIDDWRRRQFAEHNIQVIELGDYRRLRHLLSELLSEVNRLRRQRGSRSSRVSMPPCLACTTRFWSNCFRPDISHSCGHHRMGGWWRRKPINTGSSQKSSNYGTPSRNCRAVPTFSNACCLR